MNNKGFSLIELIIVIAIIGILSVIGITRFSGFIDKANIAVDEANAAEVANATKMFLSLNPDKNSVSISELVEEKYIEESSLDSDGKIKAKSSKYEKDELLIDIVEDEISIKYGDKIAYPKSSSDN